MSTKKSVKFQGTPPSTPPQEDIEPIESLDSMSDKVEKTSSSIDDKIQIPLQGRSSSFRSNRLKERQGKQSNLFAIDRLNFVVIYPALSFVAIRCEDPNEQFFLGQLQDDYTKDVDQLTVTWVEPEPDSLFRLAYDDVIDQKSIMCAVDLNENADGRFSLSPKERERILSIIDKERQESTYTYREIEENELLTSLKNDPESKPSKRSKKASKNSDEDEDEDEENDEDEDNEQSQDDEEDEMGMGSEDAPPRKKQRGTSSTKSPAGTRRRPTRSVKNSSEEKQAKNATGRKRKSMGEDVDIDDDEEDEGPKKKGRGRAAPKKKAEPKKKRFVKKKGQPDPRVMVIEKDPTFFNEDDRIIDDSDIWYVSKVEPFRAAFTHNPRLLSNLIENTEGITSIFERFSVENPITILDHIASEPEVSSELISALCQELDFTKRKARKPRVRLGKTLLKHISTGRNSFQTFGHRLGKIGVARGGKEGNNAFMDDDALRHADYSFDDLLKKLLKNPLVKSETINEILLKFPSLEEEISQWVYSLIRNGNYETAYPIVKRLFEKNGHGYNNLHVEVLQSGNVELSPFKPISVPKKDYAHSVSPIHFAAINPNEEYLKKLFKAKPDYNIEDSHKRKPVHFAAACKGAGPIQFLISRSVDLRVEDGKGKTPLMIASQLGRMEVIEAIFDGKDDDERIELVTYTSKICSENSLHVAVKHNRIEIVKKFLDLGVNIEVFDGNKHNSLMIAAQHGFFDLVNLLLDRGAKIDAIDRRKKTALTYAVKNGQLAIVSLLIHRGANSQQVDSSRNSLVHYAAAYGWFNVLKFLVAPIGEDENSPLPGAGLPANDQNDWRTTPFLLAVLKGHQNIADYLLSIEGVDVNVRNDEGRTIVAMTCMAPSKSAYKQLHHLVEEKKADVTIADNEGNTPLHLLLLNSNLPEFEHDKVENKSIPVTYPEEIIKLLVKNGAQPNAANNRGNTPLVIAIKKKHLHLISTLLEAGAAVSTVDKRGENLLHKLAREISNKNIKDIIDVLQKSSSFSPDIALQPNNAGLLPIHTLCHSIGCFEHTEDNPEKIQNHVDLIKVFISLAPKDTINLMTSTEKIKLYRGKTPEELEQLKQRAILLQKNSGKTGEQDSSFHPGRYRQPSGLGVGRGRGRGRGNQFYQNNSFGSRGNEEEEEDDDGSDDENSDLTLQGEVRKIVDSDLEKFNIQNPGFHKEFARKMPLLFLLPQLHRPAFQKLISNGMDINYQDGNGNTILHHSISLSSYQVFQYLMKMNTNPNIANNYGITPLHLAAKIHGIDFMKALIENKANINARDKDNKTPLHYSTFSRSSVEVAEVLLSNGADVNAIDNKQRAAIHYIINHSQSSSDASFDLEETFIQHGANCTLKDIRGRTPLHYAFVKIGHWKDTSSIDPIEAVTSLCALDIPIDEPDNFGATPLMYAARRGAVISSIYLLNRQAKLEAKDHDGNTALGISLLCNHPDYAIMLMQKNASVHERLAHITFQPKEGATNGELEKIVEYSTMFHVPVKSNWQGVAYMMLDAGFNYSLAIQDALSCQKFQLVFTLLKKIKDNSVLLSVSEKNQNAIHALAIFGDGTFQIDLLKKFLERGIPADHIDYKGRMPLHYAASKCSAMLSQLVDAAPAAINALDHHQQSPFAHAVKSKSLRNAGCYHAISCLDKLIGAGANIKEMIIWNKGKPKTTALIYFLRAFKNIYVPKKEENTTGSCYNVLQMLVKNRFGSPLINFQDEEGFTAIMHAVQMNRLDLVHILLSIKNINLNLVDRQGKSVIHYVVNPIEFGSFENAIILQELAKAGAILDIKDKSGKSPYFYACLQDSGVMKRTLEALGVSESFIKAPSRAVSAISEWDSVVDPQQDADEYIQKAKSQMTEENSEPVAVEDGSNLQATGKVYVTPDGLVYDLIMTKVDVNSGYYGSNNFYKMQIIHDSLKDIFFLFNRWGRIGEYGKFQSTPFNNVDDAITEFNSIFKKKNGNTWGKTPYERKPGKYKLVLLEKTNIKVKELIKPFDYSSPETPTSYLPEPVQEVLKAITNVKVLQTAMRSHGINTDLLPLGTLSKETLLSARNTLLDIKKKVEEMTEKRQEIVSETPSPSPVSGTPAMDPKMTAAAKIEIISKVMEEICELSNHFYELIPHAEFKVDRMVPISTIQLVHTKMEMINNLLELEYASKILLGAQKNLEDNKFNPLDYCYKAMNIQLEHLDSKSLEYTAIRNYVHNTAQQSVTIRNIFRLQRKSEAERITRHKDLKNHFLLWHGSNICNFMGILSQGLKIAPPEAPVSGYAFGKGVYFADMFAKSIGYCRSSSGETALLVLSEVALGEIHKLRDPEFITELPEGKNSVQGLGRVGPDFSQAITLPNGVQLPIGKTIDNPIPEDWEQVRTNSWENYYKLNHSEYIVYDTSQIRMRYLIQVKL